MVSSTKPTAYTTKELSANTWNDFEKLAAQQGTCWCTYYQRPKPVHRGKLPREQVKKDNQLFKRSLLEQGQAHAALVYHDDRPVGWCQYGVKEELPRIDAGRNYRKLEPVSGDRKLWRITCFWVDKEYRGKGVAKFALKAALDSIKRNGGGIVEAYPVVSKKMAAVPEWRWFGTPKMFERENFKPVAPLGTSLMLMRKTITSKS